MNGEAQLRLAFGTLSEASRSPARDYEFHPKAFAFQIEASH